VLGHRKNSGQSRAVRSGVLAARARSSSPWTATARTIRRRAAPGQGPEGGRSRPTLALVGGERVKRQDSSAKRFASKFGNGVRKRMLKDTANDTGCGLKAFRREAFLRLPYFDHIHRYIPALMLREGYEVEFQPVNHRHRESGVSKYTNFGRLKASVSDLLGVMWLQTRARNPAGRGRGLGGSPRGEAASSSDVPRNPATSLKPCLFTGSKGPRNSRMTWKPVRRPSPPFDSKTG
jgi:dolichol-phosphate mannosyltransferase